MASIEKRLRDGQTTWRAHYRTPAGVQRNKTFRRKVDAERFLAGVESAKVVGTYVDPALAKVTVGVLMTVVPPALAVAEPMFTTVVDPDAPPVPMFTVFVTPAVVSPVPMPYVAVVVAVPMLAEAAETVTVPEAVNMPEKVLLPVKVCVPARIASSDEVFGSV